MGYDRSDSFPSTFEPNGIPFGSKLEGKLSPRSYPIQCERKWKHSFLSVLQSGLLHTRGIPSEMYMNCLCEICLTRCYLYLFDKVNFTNEI